MKSCPVSSSSQDTGIQLSTLGSHSEENDKEYSERAPPVDKHSNQREEGDLSWNKWSRGVVVCVLWLAQVVTTSAYSLVAPFFPLEVDQYLNSI